MILKVNIKLKAYQKLKMAPRPETGLNTHGFQTQTGRYFLLLTPFRFEQQIKEKLSQKCIANQSEEDFLIMSFMFFDFSNSGEVDYPTF